MPINNNLVLSTHYNRYRFSIQKSTLQFPILDQVEKEEIALAVGDHHRRARRHRARRLHFNPCHDHRHSVVGRKKDPRPLQEREQAQAELGRRGWSDRFTHSLASFGKSH